tara:strand:- start:9047 stop:9385 length:339 start_codon:yes stop_codon:yes gene_type:complete
MTNNLQYPAFSLWVSQRNAPKLCDNVFDAMRICGISGNVTSNKSIQCTHNGKKCWREDGCHIIGNGTKVDIFWNFLKINNKLTCGRLDIPGVFSGCIIDYLNPNTKCVPKPN